MLCIYGDCDDTLKSNKVTVIYEFDKHQQKGTLFIINDDRRIYPCEQQQK